LEFTEISGCLVNFWEQLLLNLFYPCFLVDPRPKNVLFIYFFNLVLLPVETTHGPGGLLVTFIFHSFALLYEFVHIVETGLHPRASVAVTDRVFAVKSVI
jgi:hypothetical protein